MIIPVPVSMPIYRLSVYVCVCVCVCVCARTQNNTEPHLMLSFSNFNHNISPIFARLQTTSPARTTDAHAHQSRDYIMCH